MRLTDHLQLSASDLANHLGCRHLTALDLATAHGRATPPAWKDPALEALIERGFEHESQYLDHLRAQNLTVVPVTPTKNETATAATLRTMKTGVDVITQATLTDGPGSKWFGRTDVLRRVDTPSNLGPYSYEVLDTKLARETRGGTILQLCLYSDMLGTLQGLLPERMYVVAPGTDFEPEVFRLHDYFAYYRLVKSRLETSVSDSAGAAQPTYPEPVAKCDTCRWWPKCDAQRHEDDHLSLVAGISAIQRAEATACGAETLAQLAALPVPLQRRPRRGSPEGFIRAREQARVQLAGREREQPVHELLALESECGLARLPAPSAGDMFFDLEGARFFGEGGLEYLFGWTDADGDSASYRATWAVDDQQERAAFEAFVDTVMQRWAEDPDLHIYHYAPYEPVALKRLMGRYATREDEVDQMLRAKLFVDLYAVTKQALRASVESYSIKALEPFYGYVREVELRLASKSLHAFDRALERGEVDSVPTEVRDAVERYNRDDCVSTLELRDWLESLRAGVIAGGEEIPRPVAADGAASDDVSERQQAVLALMERLLDGVPEERGDRSQVEQARWLLAHLLDWHRRENKVPIWEGFRLADLTEEELVFEKASVTGLEFAERVGGTAKCPIDRYRFPAQETGIRRDAPLKLAGGTPVGTLVAVDMTARTIDIKKRQDSADVHPTAVFGHKVMRNDKAADALFRLGAWVAQHGVDAPGDHRAARDLLLGLAPRRRHADAIQTLQQDNETTLAAARRLALELDGGVLAIQGPPGAGKTYTGARMICELVRAGKKVGVVATSHRVIANLLDEVVGAASDEELPIRCIRKVSGTAAPDEGQIILETTDNADVATALENGTAQVAAGTAWLWAREEFANAVDVLFVDEAGQMSLANVLAVAQAAGSVVLLGDPQQLEQPQQGSHPEGADTSALVHILGEDKTIRPTRGLFLPETWRLHPAICKLTSELFYEGRLSSLPGLSEQAILGKTPFAGAGLWFAPVAHSGNQNTAPEEVDRVVAIYDDLLTGDVRWRDREGNEAPITAQEVLIVAPYNAQVSALLDRLPDARVGTVDKFQGQEAPIVIFSMATSSPEDAPRGMEFLFSLNRLNVATSRARCVCVLVASPRLLEPECRTPRQIQLANAFCRYAELATEC